MELHLATRNGGRWRRARELAALKSLREASVSRCGPVSFVGIALHLVHPELIISHPDPWPDSHLLFILADGWPQSLDPHFLAAKAPRRAQTSAALTALKFRQLCFSTSCGSARPLTCGFPYHPPSADAVACPPLRLYASKGYMIRDLWSILRQSDFRHII